MLEIPPQPERPQPAPEPPSPPKLKPIDREQSVLRVLQVDELVPEDHKVRAIWELTGGWTLDSFYANIQSREGAAGRAAWNPRLLLAVWLYSYSEQVTSAREVERMMEYEPGLMWLAGLGEINHHTLSDFRANHAQELQQIMQELLAMLSLEGLVKLELVAHDGTKVRAQAGADTLRREKTLEQELANAKQVLEQLERERQNEGEGDSLNRRQAARQRAARERDERLHQAQQELEKIRKTKRKAEREQARVSLTEPEARVMKHGDQSMAPSYNVQLSTDAEHKIVVGVHLTQCSSDSRSLAPAMEEVHANLGSYPRQVVADGGFTNTRSIQAMQDKEIDFYGSLGSEEARQAGAMKAAGIDVAFAPAKFVILEPKKTLQCPAGKELKYVRHSRKRGEHYHQYQASGSDCSACEFQKQCCPKLAGRTVSIRQGDKTVSANFRQKMASEEARAIYRRRGAIAEFPNCWIKEKIGLRKFRLRGLAKAGIEACWAVLTYNAMQWMRLAWRPGRTIAAGAAA